jgi:KDO2-lipid IV(A) lauroyltransferase
LTRNVQKRLVGRAGEAALRSLQSWLAGKTPEQAERIGERLGTLFGKLAKKRFSRAVDNLSLVFPDLAPEARVELAKEVFRHFGRATTDFLIGKGRTLQELEQSTTVVGRHHLEEALARGQGALLVTGHLGNWERASAWVALAGYPISVVTRDADDEGVNRFVNDIRRSSGVNIIPRGKATRQIIERLRKGESIGILPDQNAGDAFLPFFGKPAGTNLGVGVIQERTGAPIVPTWCYRSGPCHYRLEFEPALDVPQPTERKGEAAMLQIHGALERAISAHPEQWLWFHDRWRYARFEGLI